MNIVKCKNGHYFDSDTYSHCPHCGEQTQNANGSAPAPAPSTDQKPEKRGFWGRKKTKEQAKQSKTPEVNTPNYGFDIPPAGAPANGQPYAASPIAPPPQQPASPDDSCKTVALADFDKQQRDLKETTTQAPKKVPPKVNEVAPPPSPAPVKPRCSSVVAFTLTRFSPMPRS